MASGGVTAAPGGPTEPAATRLLRHAAHVAQLEDGDAIARAAAAAALDVVPLDSAVLVWRGEHGELAPAYAIGPLAAALTATDANALAEHATHAATTLALDPYHAPELAPLHAAGARALVTVALTAHGEAEGMLLLASATPVEATPADLGLLELLAAHTAGALRGAALIRSLRERAATDPLTGLGHYASFHDALARAHRRPSTAVVVCDVDDFKRLNDTYGHQHGDHVLCAVAAALSSALRRGDALYRVGGDEFAGLLAVADEAEALDAGLRLHAAVRDAGLGVSVSIGVAVPRAGDEPDGALLARADGALYQVKHGGRDGVALAGEEPAALATPG